MERIVSCICSKHRDTFLRAQFEANILNKSHYENTKSKIIFRERINYSIN